MNVVNAELLQLYGFIILIQHSCAFEITSEHSMEATFLKVKRFSLFFVFLPTKLDILSVQLFVSGISKKSFYIFFSQNFFNLKNLQSFGKHDFLK